MTVTYNPLLVLLSVMVAIQASYVGLRLTMQVRQIDGLRRRLVLVGASSSLAMGIWGMHFVGMLAARLPPGIAYQVLPTLISFLLCMLVVGFAVVGASLGPRMMGTLVVTGTVMGLGIASMHYIGMMALHDSLHMTHDWRFVLASVLAAIAASTTALWLATMATRRPPLIVCALVLGVAISSMHYIAMGGMSYHAMAMAAADQPPSLSDGLMAIVVAVVAFIISASFLLTLVPEPARVPPTAEPPAQASVEDASPDPPLAAEPRLPDPGVSIVQDVPRPIPVERDGTVVLLPQNEIYAVRANAHYAYIFNGHEELFCSLSIGDIEERLADGPFYRVHRSHIVNVERVAVVRKTADGGFAELAGSRPVTVPISRAKVGPFKARFDTRSAGSLPP